MPSHPRSAAFIMSTNTLDMRWIRYDSRV